MLLIILLSLAGLFILPSQAAMLEEEVTLLVGLLSGSQDLSQLLRWVRGDTVIVLSHDCLVMSMGGLGVRWPCPLCALSDPGPFGFL
jgi:hypothetical protein